MQKQKYKSFYIILITTIVVIIIILERIVYASNNYHNMNKTWQIKGTYKIDVIRFNDDGDTPNQVELYFVIYPSGKRPGKVDVNRQVHGLSEGSQAFIAKSEFIRIRDIPRVRTEEFNLYEVNRPETLVIEVFENDKDDRGWSFIGSSFIRPENGAQDTYYGNYLGSLVFESGMSEWREMISENGNHLIKVAVNWRILDQVLYHQEYIKQMKSLPVDVLSEARVLMPEDSASEKWAEVEFDHVSNVIDVNPKPVLALDKPPEGYDIDDSMPGETVILPPRVLNHIPCKLIVISFMENGRSINIEYEKDASIYRDPIILIQKYGNCFAFELTDSPNGEIMGVYSLSNYLLKSKNKYNADINKKIRLPLMVDPILNNCAKKILTSVQINRFELSFKSEDSKYKNTMSNPIYLPVSIVATDDSFSIELPHSDFLSEIIFSNSEKNLPLSVNIGEFKGINGFNNIAKYLLISVDSSKNCLVIKPNIEKLLTLKIQVKRTKDGMAFDAKPEEMKLFSSEGNIEIKFDNDVIESAFCKLFVMMCEQKKIDVILAFKERLRNILPQITDKAINIDAFNARDAMVSFFVDNNKEPLYTKPANSWHLCNSKGHQLRTDGKSTLETLWTYKEAARKKEEKELKLSPPMDLYYLSEAIIDNEDIDLLNEFIGESKNVYARYTYLVARIDVDAFANFCPSATIETKENVAWRFLTTIDIETGKPKGNVYRITGWDKEPYQDKDKSIDIKICDIKRITIDGLKSRITTNVDSQTFPMFMKSIRNSTCDAWLEFFNKTNGIDVFLRDTKMAKNYDRLWLRCDKSEWSLELNYDCPIFARLDLTEEIVDSINAGKKVELVNNNQVLYTLKEGETSLYWWPNKKINETVQEQKATIVHIVVVNGERKYNDLQYAWQLELRNIFVKCLASEWVNHNEKSKTEIRLYLYYIHSMKEQCEKLISFTLPNESNNIEDVYKELCNNVSIDMFGSISVGRGPISNQAEKVENCLYQEHLLEGGVKHIVGVIFDEPGVDEIQRPEVRPANIMAVDRMYILKGLRVKNPLIPNDIERMNLGSFFSLLLNSD